MAEKLKRWAAPIAVLILIWVAWSGLRRDIPKRAERPKLPSVELADIPLRASSEATTELGDPCRLRQVSVEPPPSPNASALPITELAKPSDTHVVERPPTEIAPATGRVPRVLTLDAILVASVGAQALISGQTVAVGSAIEGIDPDDPPILAWIDGVRAGVSWRGREYVLDLDRARRVTLGAAANGTTHPEAGP